MGNSAIPLRPWTRAVARGDQGDAMHPGAGFLAARDFGEYNSENERMPGDIKSLVVEKLNDNKFSAHCARKIFCTFSSRRPTRAYSYEFFPRLLCFVGARIYLASRRAVR